MKKRIYDLNRIQQDVLKDSPKVRISVLVILGLFILGVLIYNIIKFDVLFFVLDLILLGIFVFYLVCNVTVREVEQRKYRYKQLDDDDLYEIRLYIDLIGKNKNNYAKKQYLEKILKRYEDFKESEKKKIETPEEKREVFDLEEIERFAKENNLEYKEEPIEDGDSVQDENEEKPVVEVSGQSEDDGRNP